MDENVLAALVSAGVSVIITVIYWVGKQIYQFWAEKELFKTYKNYAIESLELILKYQDKDISCDIGEVVYESDLCNSKIAGIMPVTNKDNCVVLYVLYKLKYKYILTKNQEKILINILHDIPLNLFHDHIINNTKTIYFSIFENSNMVVCKEIKDKMCYTPNFNIIKKALDNLKKGELDNFIKSSIKELV